ncbi:MAG: NUDIX hydrolase [Oscillospiraceae bacterium]|jgi:ADP-ribose pyrophosphatase|nr:NUDIX hydrolase [Oscillospiraceae bacterium]
MAAGAEFTEKRVSGKIEYTGKVFSVRRDIVELHTGKRVEREVVEHSGGVVILPFTDNGKILMVRQYRYPLEKTMLELPAGRIEPGERPRAAAKRELSEETGCTARKLLYMGVIYPSPGFCDEALHMYAAIGLKRGKSHPDEDEHLTMTSVPLDKVTGMIMSNAIKDAKTLVGITKFLTLMSHAIEESDGEDGGA